MSSSKTTEDHGEIRAWVEKRSGRPARVKQEGLDDHSGILRIDFQEPDAKLEQIEWDEFFDIFERSKLAFLYQDETGGHKVSRFNKFVNRGR